jgi:hypothetical protein
MVLRSKRSTFWSRPARSASRNAACGASVSSGLPDPHHALEAAPAGQFVLKRDNRLVRALGAFAVARPGEMDGQGRLLQRGFHLAPDVAHVLEERRLGQHPVPLSHQLIEHPVALVFEVGAGFRQIDRGLGGLGRGRALDGPEDMGDVLCQTAQALLIILLVGVEHVEVTRVGLLHEELIAAWSSGVFTTLTARNTFPISKPPLRSAAFRNSSNSF